MGSQDFPLPSSASNKIELTSDDDFQWIVRSSRQSTLLFDSLLSEIHFRLKCSWHVPSEMTAAAVMTSQRRIDRNPHSHQPFPPNFQSSLRWEGQEKQLLKISAAEHRIIYFAYFILTILAQIQKIIGTIFPQNLNNFDMGPIYACKMIEIFIFGLTILLYKSTDLYN